MNTTADVKTLAHLGKTIIEEVSQALGQSEENPTVLVIAASILQSIGAYYLTHKTLGQPTPSVVDPLAEPPDMDVLPNTP
jgi:hypothetical protein